MEKSPKKWHLGKKLEDFDKKEQEDQEGASSRRLDFTDHSPGPVLEQKYFGGFTPGKEDGQSGDHHKPTPKPERARFLNLLAVEQRGFFRYRQPDPGWAGRQEDVWPPFVVRALAEVHLRNSSPPRQEDPRDERSGAAAMFNVIRRCEKLLPNEYRRRPAWLGWPTGPMALQLERAKLYHKTGRRLEPSEKLELKRMPKLSRFKTNPLLTKEYLYGEPPPKPGSTKRWGKRAAVEVREVVGRRPLGISLVAWQAKQWERKLDPIKTEWPEIQGKPFLLPISKQSKLENECSLLVGQFLCPPETSTTMLHKRKVGRPSILGRPMTDAEYKRRSRAKVKTLPPQERNEPGAVVPLPFGPAVPGPNLIIERNRMLLEKMAHQQDQILDRLDQILECLLKDPDRPITREEFQILAVAGTLGRQRPH